MPNEQAPRRLSPQHPNGAAAAKQIDTAHRRIGQMLLDNQSLPLLMSIAYATGALISDMSPTPEAAVEVTNYFLDMIPEAVANNLQTKLAATPPAGEG